MAEDNTYRCELDGPHFYECKHCQISLPAGPIPDAILASEIREFASFDSSGVLRTRKWVSLEDFERLRNMIGGRQLRSPPVDLPVVSEA